MDKTRIKAVLFDMDGVLIDAKEWHYESLNMALRLFGYEISRNEHLSKFDGLPTKKKLEMLSEVKGLPIGLHGFINELKQEYTIQIIFQKCWPNFQHQYALNQLINNNIKIVCCSNSISKTMRLMLERAKILQYFDFTLSNEDVVKPKPSPEIYLKAMQRLGLQPFECLILEDNENGIKSAIESGANLLRIATVKDVNWTNISQTLLHYGN